MLALMALAASALLTPGGAAAGGVVAWRAGSPRLMAGFGKSTAPNKAAKASKAKVSGKAASKAANKAARSSGLSAKRQWDAHAELVKGGGATTSVWARAAASEEPWLQVGTVSAPDAAMLPVAAHAQKRLILEHAGRLSPRFLMIKALECGYGDDADKVMPVAKGIPPEDVTCGLVGLPDPGGFYKRSPGDMRTGATASTGAAPASDSKGRIS